MKKRIKYICYYHSLDSDKPRECVQAATTKVDYIVSVMNRQGFIVDIISPAIISAKGFCPSFGGVNEMGVNTLRLFPSFGFLGLKTLMVISRWVTNYCFKQWLSRNIKKDEEIIVYHSLGYCSLFVELKKKIGFKMIGEIEEVYQDVNPQSVRISKNEYEFFKNADKYIFPNTVMNEKINLWGKLNLVIHGIYSVQPDRGVKFDDGRIHVLYSGTFDPVKGGAMATIETSEYLPENYHIHVTGFGDKRDQVELEKKAKQVQCKTKAMVTFHGFISREDFYLLTQRCQLGLCTQDPSKTLNLTSFPSKILNYMSSGLVVLSGRNRAVEESAVGDLLYYYKIQSPECIAKTITTIQNTDGEICKNRLRQLDVDFEIALLKFLKS